MTREAPVGGRDEGAAAAVAGPGVGGPDAAGAVPVRRWEADHAGELRRHLERMLPGPGDADDVLQEVWVTAWRNPPDTGPGSNVRGWLYRVATNAALDRLARDRRRRSALEGRAHDVRPEPSPAPDHRLDGLGPEGRRRVRERVSRLPPKQRDAVWLRWIEGADYGRVARALECSRESARANVYQGLKKLREELFDLWEEEFPG